MTLSITSTTGALLAVLALSLTGCGGASGDSATADAAPSKAQFTKKAVAICLDIQKASQTRLKRYVAAHPESLNIQPEIARDALVMELLRPLSEKQAKELAALPAPAGDEAKIDAMVAATEAGIKHAEADPEATILGTYREANKLTSEYGLEECAIP
jgi:hypothetical protein